MAQHIDGFGDRLRLSTIGPLQYKANDLILRGIVPPSVTELRGGFSVLFALKASNSQNSSSKKELGSSTMGYEPQISLKHSN